jgi:hypothetical protein
MVQVRKSRKESNRLPGMVDARVLGMRVRQALRQAGYVSQAEAVRAIQKAVPGSKFGKQDLSALIRGKRMPLADRVLTLAVMLGLDLKILYPEAFDAHGRPITPMSHPDLFRGGCRKLPRQGYSPRMTVESRNPGASA